MSREVMMTQIEFLCWFVIVFVYTIAIMAGVVWWTLVRPENEAPFWVFAATVVAALILGTQHNILGFLGAGFGAGALVSSVIYAYVLNPVWSVILLRERGR